MRNTESHFSMLPKTNIRRSNFKRSSRHLTTFNAGKLVPIFVDEVLPGDTFSCDTSAVIRMSTPIHPTMDDAFLDYYFFFIPNRLVWDKWQEFMGENTHGPWTFDAQTYQVPHIQVANGKTVYKGSVADYMGIPTNVSSLNFNALYPRAYALTWNEWFRGENAFQPCDVSNEVSDDLEYIAEDGLYLGSACRGGMLCPVAKFHDYFTSALPTPQKGPDVFLPFNAQAPVYTSDKMVPGLNSASLPMTFHAAGSNASFTNGTNYSLSGFYNTSSSNGRFLGVVNPQESSSATGGNVSVVPANLFADLSSVEGTTINQLREALALQRFYEIDARGGTRYTEILRSHFGVVSPDSRLQRPEYIGGKRIRLNMQQVAQTSSTDSVTPQGNLAAYSLTGDNSDSFTYSAVEHGIILGVCCVRTTQTYQYGLNRMFSRRDRTDYYFPVFAHLGEQAVLNKEIYFAGESQDEQVFGYQEAWAEYRYKQNIVTGAFRSNYEGGSLDSWHYAEKLEGTPTLSPDWLSQSANVIDRTLAVSSEVEDQFLADFYFDLSCVRPMPTYSIPGLSNHF